MKYKVEVSILSETEKYASESVFIQVVEDLNVQDVIVAVNKLKEAK